jgi:hypothetical protein
MDSNHHWRCRSGLSRASFIGAVQDPLPLWRVEPVFKAAAQAEDQAA